MAEPPATPARRRGSLPPNPLTPEQVRRMEEARLKAKALRSQADAAARASGDTPHTTPSGFLVAGQKRPHSSRASSARPLTTNRDARNNASPPQTGVTQPAADANVRPAKKFQKNNYIEYDFSQMTDTKGGFLSAADDPHNKALYAGTDPSRAEQKPAHMTLEEWERHQLLKKLRQQKAGPFEPGISVLKDKEVEKMCRECGNLEIDWKWDEIFGCRICSGCREKFPDKYSLLTKTEAREDYLLTDPELKDEELLPHLERPNPHKANWNNMQLFLRYQVEEYAFSDKKWGSPEALDAEFERRQVDKKSKKEKKFQKQLHELKKKTRVDAYQRSRALAAANGEGKEAQFGDRVVGRYDKHEHEWGRALEDPETGMTKKRCVECGMEVEELEF